MEDEEARLKALLEQTDDFDERRKIRADLRAVRKKMLDSLSATAEAESNERAARRAERARARKVEEETNHIGPAITDQILAEIDDQDTLQKLLDEIPTSQIEDRRRIRAKIREVKRKKTEEEEAAAPRGRRTREMTTESSEETSTRDRRRHIKTASEESIEIKRDEPASVTIETTSNEASSVTIKTASEEIKRYEPASVTIETTSNEASSVTIKTASEEQPTVTVEAKPEEPSVEITSDEPSSVNLMETISDETSGVSIETSADMVAIKTTSATTNHVDDDGEFKFKLTLRQSKDIRIEEDTEDIVEQSSVDIDRAVEVPNKEPIGTPVEIKIEHCLDENHLEEDEEIDEGNVEEAEIPVSQCVQELPTEEVRSEEKMNGEVDSDEDGSMNVANGVSVQLRVDSEVNLNIEMENQSESNEDVKEPAIAADRPDGGKISKDNRNETSKDTSPSETKPSRGGPPQDDDKKKIGKVNQVDFRTNLKKSGKIGQSKGIVNLEKKNSTTGAQVDFRADSLKKSGRIGAGTVNLEKKISTQGAQVDFRSSSLKPSGKVSGVVNLERRTKQTGAQVDFRSNLKKGGGTPAVKSPGERKGSLRSETPEKRIEESGKKMEEISKSEESEQPVELDLETAAEEDSGKEDILPASIIVAIPAPVEQKPPAKKEPPPVPTKEKRTAAAKEKVILDDESEELPAQVDIKLEVKVDSPSVDKEATPVVNSKVEEDKGKNDSKYKPRDSYKTREDTKSVSGGKSKLFDKLSKFQAKDETAVKPKVSTPVSRSEKASEKAVNGLAVKVENTSITSKEAPVQIEVTEHVEDDGDTHTEVREEKTTTQDGVEEKVTTKTTTPDGGKVTMQSKETKTTTKKTFMDPELQKRMAARQRDRVAAKREQTSSTKNKRMAFMQKLEANAPAQKVQSNVKRSGSNVDKLLAWCRFKLRDYEGVKLTNFSSSWADGLAFCALIHLYIPDKIPYEELLAGGDKRRNFETAFSVATEDGVAELLEVDDMMLVTNPEPKSVMTYVSSIYKHFNPS